MKKTRKNRSLSIGMLLLAFTAASLSACSSTSHNTDASGNTVSSGSAALSDGDAVSAGAEASGDVTFVFGDTTFNAENEQPDINPHNAYSGWACIRYGVGETLFRYSDTMEIEPWLASDYELVDELTWKITLRNDVTFSNGKALDGDAVKACLEHLIEVHDRAKGDLMIDEITADGQTVTITTTEPVPTLLNYLSDPYGCMIDMEAGITDDGMVVGTGPYTAVSLSSSQELDLVKNENYWNGEPGYDNITVLTITDGDTLTMALQAGEIDGAYGLPYSSLTLFENDNYTISGCATSRTFFAHMNFESEIIQDDAVRQALAMGIDKERFVNDLLDGNGYAAEGAFPDSFSFGGDAVTAASYDPEGAKEILEEAGWVDSDGDGIREKDGEKLTIRWLTYPSRQELPVLAEASQATLGAIGFEVIINSTADHNSIRSDTTAWDVYVSAMVTAPTGDPAYFFTTHCLDSSAANNGHYHSDALEALANELAVTFDTETRAQLAVKMQQTLLDDNAFIFISCLQMNMITKSDVTGLTAHPCDFYEISVDLKPTVG